MIQTNLAKAATAPDIRDAVVTGVVDGDTIDVDIEFDFPKWVKELSSLVLKPRVRFTGIDAPPYEKDNPQSPGKPAFDFLVSKIPPGTKVKMAIKTYRDKYARIYAEVWVDGEDKSVNQQLVEAGHAIIYKDLEAPNEVA